MRTRDQERLVSVVAMRSGVVLKSLIVLTSGNSRNTFISISASTGFRNHDWNYFQW